MLYRAIDPESELEILSRRAKNKSTNPSSFQSLGSATSLTDFSLGEDIGIILNLTDSSMKNSEAVNDLETENTFSPCKERYFYYKTGEIDGIVVNVENGISCAKASVFGSIIQKFGKPNCPFYHLSTNGEIALVSSEKIMSTITLDKGIMRIVYTQYQNIYLSGLTQEGNKSIVAK